MPEGAEPTLWEIWRLTQRIDNRLTEMQQSFVPLGVFQAYQEAQERRFVTQEKDLSEWTVESRGEHVRLDKKVDAERREREALERSQREARGRTWLALGVAVLGFLSSLVVTILSNLLGGG